MKITITLVDNGFLIERNYPSGPGYATVIESPSHDIEKVINLLRTILPTSKES